MVQIFLLTGLAFASLAAAQSDLFSGAPACAQACGVLTTAANTCYASTPNQPLSVTANCFCSAPAIAGFRTDPSICPNCSGSEGTAWYAALCANIATITAGAPDATAAPPTSTEPSTVVESAPATTTESLTSATASDGSIIYVPAEQGSWWDNHAKWVAMVIVLVVVFSIIIVVGVIWKKRYNRKHNLADRVAPGTPFGPTQHNHHPGVGSDVNVNHRDAEKGRVPLGPQVYDATPERESKSGKLKKLVGR